MARTNKPKSVVFNNYVTVRLVNQEALGAGATDVEAALFYPGAKFKVSRVCFDALGTTASAFASIRESGSEDIIAPSVTISGAMPAAVTTGNLTQVNRIVPKGSAIVLRLSTDGTGAIPAGAVAAWVTGYYMEPISRSALYAESGQQCGEGPVAGYYDLLSLVNLRANANQAARQECAILAPYAGRVMSIYYDIRGHTETTGTITADVRKNDATIQSTVVDVDQAEQYILDVDANVTFASSAARDFVQGDELSLYVGSGLNDIVPIGTLTTNLLVWVKGHVRDAGAEPTVED